MDTVADNLKRITEQIAGAAERSGRAPDQIILVAVSKLVPFELLQEAVAAGQRVFGENYVQAAQRSFKPLSGAEPPIELHMIGALQRNKARPAVALFDMIQTVDRAALAKELASEALRAGKRQRVLLQVNISGEESKSGCCREEAVELCAEVASYEALQLEGLMCIGTWLGAGAGEAERREEFRAMRSLRDAAAAVLGRPLPQLSMGMSEDFEAAIEEGATIVRIGSAIFGERRRR